jgi:translation initiation factor IF-1
MSKKEGIIELEGVVVKAHPSTKFTVKVNDPELNVMCTISGKLRQNKIKIYENDKVRIELSVYDVTTGRIIWRY